MLTPDTVLKDRYVIIRKLGSGGQGHVYEALDKNLDSRVAIKEAILDREDYRHAFSREARLLANLRHQIFPKVAEYFSQKNTLYLVMEFIPGEDLEQLMKTRKNAPFELALVLHWADAILDALDYLHNVNPEDPIIHRDIKPGNIKLTARGEVVLLDFGLARGSAGEMSTMTSKRSVIGYTPGYAPPEQSLRHPVWADSLSLSFPSQHKNMIAERTNAGSDLYSLAATLYRLMTGVSPTDAPKRCLHVWGGKADPLLPADQLDPNIPKELSDVLLKALSLEREERFTNAADMRQAMRAAARDLASVETQWLAPASTLPPAQSETVVDRAATTLTLPQIKYGILGRCGGSIRCISFSPDGLQLVTGGNDNAIRLWNVVSGEARLIGHGGEGKSGFSYVSGVSFAPDGEHISSVGNDRAIRLWNITTGEKRVLGKYGHPLRSVAFSPDGEFIVCGSSDGTVQLWELETEQIDILGRCEGVVWSVNFSPDGQAVAAESDDQTIRIWNLRSRLMSTIKSEDSDIRSLCFSPDGRSISGVGTDCTLRVWDLQSAEGRLIGKCNEPIRSIAYSPSGDYIASGGEDKTVRLWNLKTRTAKTLGACDDVVSAVAFSPDGHTVASGSWDSTVRLWKV